MTTAAYETRDRRALRRLACDVLGVTEEQRRDMYERGRPELQQAWAIARDQEALLGQYAEDWYAVLCVECFADYARAYAMRFAEWWGANGSDGPILDVGGGIGAAARLVEDETGSRCVLHAIDEGAQTKIARRVVRELFVCPDPVEAINAVSPRAVMAFDVLEHVREPLPLLRAITASPAEAFCCANSYVEDFGHWRTYLVDGVGVPRNAMGRWFGKTMRSLGWRSETTGFWNNRPAIWTRAYRQEEIWDGGRTNQG
jgi:hypothetical protein